VQPPPLVVTLPCLGLDLAVALLLPLSFAVTLPPDLAVLPRARLRLHTLKEWICDDDEE
jgi:hypothetical protein